MHFPQDDQLENRQSLRQQGPLQVFDWIRPEHAFPLHD